MTDPGRSGGEGTGWHMHPSKPQSVWRDDVCIVIVMRHEQVPVLVLDPITARDTIARALGEHRVDMWACSCGWPLNDSVGSVVTHITDELLAALASQERVDG